MSYKLSTDYEKLYELINNGTRVAAFVDYSFSGVDEEDICRDICTIRKLREREITFSARGITYGGVNPWNRDEGGEKQQFIDECDRMNLQYIPTER